MEIGGADEDVGVTLKLSMAFMVIFGKQRKRVSNSISRLRAVNL